jgi:hypothetical protein
MYKTWVELEERIGEARDGMQTMLANRNKAAASRKECWQPAQMGQFGTREIRGVEELG